LNLLPKIKFWPLKGLSINNQTNNKILIKLSGLEDKSIPLQILLKFAPHANIVKIMLLF
jgi:hypothetical protein